MKTLTETQTGLLEPMMKRGFDLIVSGLGLVVISPLLAVIALLILVFEGRPIFFLQHRPGLGGRPFRIVKFRTMFGEPGKESDEARLSRLGSFLRSFSLDELPELWNVFVGEMSLVGPRPLLMRYVNRYTSAQARRHEAKPGITGWAQVNGRNSLSWEAKFNHDVFYVDHQSFVFDLKILFLTFFKTIKREGISAKGCSTMPEFKQKTKPVEMSSAEITEQDIEAVVGVLRSGRLALGPKVMEFEEKVAKHVGVKHAIAVSSGTAALHLIVKALGIGPGDEVLVPSFTFAASVNAILYEGATPVFVDIRPDTYNLDSNDLEKKRTSKTKAIMAVDVFGHPIDWAPVEAFAKRHKLSIIDDSCEALGAEYHGRKVGSFGDAGAFAFYPNKQITTGEGGMIVTDREDIAKLARSYRNQGRDEMGAWLEHVRMGYNYRMDEMSGALGSSQMDRLDSILAKREAVAMKYSKGLAGVEGVRIPQVLPEMKMSWFVYVITLSEGVNTEELMKDLENRGVPSRAYFSPIHLQAYLTTENVYATHSDLPVTRAICGRTIALPFHANLRDDEIDYVVNELKAILSSKKSNTNRVA